MPRRLILSTLERESLLEFPKTSEELIRHYTLGKSEQIGKNSHRILLKSFIL